MSTTTDHTGARWVASSYSGNGGGNCLEWAPDVVASAGTVPLRDSKAPEGPFLSVGVSAWSSFVELAKAMEL